MRCAASGEELPAAHDDIGISGADLQTVADATGHLGRDHARARAEKRVIDRLAGPAVVDDRAAHALDRLLGAVSPALLALPAAIRIHAGDFPERGLRAVAFASGWPCPRAPRTSRSRASSENRRGPRQSAAWPRRSEREAATRKRRDRRQR